MSQFTVIYEFDRFRLDRKNQRLTRDGILVTMSGKSLSILAALIEHRDKVLSTEKLVNAFFPRSLQAEEDLTGEILTIKRLLDDTSSSVPMVRTIAGKGYQFDA
jgi:DNA-binding winged helix-turn-helix (wHTH) protein